MEIKERMNRGNHIKLFYLAFAIIGLCNVKLKAQSIHFSQAYAAHLTLNPANTGRFNGDWRAVVMHRHQGYRLSNDFRTSYFSFEHPVYFKDERFNVGFFYSLDNSAGNALPVNRLNLSMSNAIRLGHGSFLLAGLQVAWVNLQLNLDGVTFPDQYNREIGGFDPWLPTADNFENFNTSYLDVGLGLLYARNFRNGPFSVGYSLQQVNRPDISFLLDRHSLSFKHVAHSKADIYLGNSMFVIPLAVVISTGGASSSLIGLNLGYNLNEWIKGTYNSAIAGVHLRNATKGQARSLVFSVGASVSYWTLMLSHDSDISNTKTSRFASNGLELAVVYKLPSTAINRITLPWERY